MIVPAVLSKSRASLIETLDRYAAFGASRVQIDVVDGVFATPASWPYNAPGELEELVQKGKSLPHLDTLTYEIDLMCVDAEKAALMWAALGVTRFTVHIEGIPEPRHYLERVRQGLEHSIPGLISLGAALNVSTPTTLLDAALGEAGYVQFMGIATIGRQGEPFDKRTPERIKRFHTTHPEVAIQVDGGVSLANASELFAVGVTDLIVGSGILRAEDPRAAYEAFEALEASSNFQ